MDAALEVQARHQEALMAVPGVVGVAVGLSRDGRSTAIHIYVASLSPEVRESLPTELDGVPVEIVETGEFRAL